ncbi:hypothetical protein B0H13DRAFT_1902891 [Mycena leptocephala]|nr:hypothetical protein B0H13DRAFT_1902891 [Mycena leptocephala]
MTSALGDEKYVQAHFSAKQANGLASRSAGLGLGATLKSKPKPEKARLRGCKPVLQAEKLTLICLHPDIPRDTSCWRCFPIPEGWPGALTAVSPTSGIGAGVGVGGRGGIWAALFPSGRESGRERVLERLALLEAHAAQFDLGWGVVPPPSPLA